MEKERGSDRADVNLSDGWASGGEARREIAAAEKELYLVFVWEWKLCLGVCRNPVDVDLRM